MNELKVFEKTDVEKLKEIEKINKNSYMGFFYLLEWDNIVKIGYSQKPHQRLMSLKRTAGNYNGVNIGRMALSKGHTNYRDNENLLHKHFLKHRINGTELFSLTFEEALSKIPDDIIFKDETNKREAKAEILFDGMKNFIMGGF